MKIPGNVRLHIGMDGNVTILGKSPLFLNFGNESRAQSYLQRRLADPRFAGSKLKSFQVPISYLDDLRESSVSEDLARQFPDRPFRVDINQGNDQFGLRSNLFSGLLEAIVPGGGRIH